MKLQKPKIRYSAVVLGQASKNLLIQKTKQWFGQEITGWDIQCDHMTICIGSLPVRYVHQRGKKIGLRIEEIGSSDLVKAVKVVGFPSTNQTPHITLAVNASQGGKPVMSNLIQDWEEIENFILMGTVQEISEKF